MPVINARKLAGWISGVCALTVCTALQAGSLPDENAADWSLSTTADNIRIYTIEQPDSSFKAFKAVAIMDVPIENLMAVMIDPTSCTAWVHGCTESYGFGEGSFDDRYAYSVNDMPWPVADRDYVLHIQTDGDRDSGEVVMHLNAVPDHREQFDQYVRVDRSDTLYRFIPEGQQTRMIWLQHTDPNGALPSWLVNSLLVDIPVKSLKNLEQVAQLPRYQNHQLDYNSNGQLTGVSLMQSGDDAASSNR
ncbi:START domain-containing protein [Marinobacter zhejiangensis]|uniref:START domain-containing protein n=1 Tax=Marinobacter zhejiangensis TaxID=488535 RepID=A0A1I4N7S4_9GAMM|nr:START domain-containing protein [Marinobacter zhejiangensis]SFM11293.1 START domain-containing protein [Marinobacter zhejiangensis]